LVPHRRKNAELGIGRRAADQLQDLLVFVELQSVVGNKLWRDGDVVVEGHRGIREWPEVGYRACGGRWEPVGGRCSLRFVWLAAPHPSPLPGGRGGDVAPPAQ